MGNLAYSSDDCIQSAFWLLPCPQMACDGSIGLSLSIYVRPIFARRESCQPHHQGAHLDLCASCVLHLITRSQSSGWVPSTNYSCFVQALHPIVNNPQPCGVNDPSSCPHLNFSGSLQATPPGIWRSNQFIWDRRSRPNRAELGHIDPCCWS